MRKLASMGDGKTEREKIQAVEVRRRKMSRGSNEEEGAEETKDGGEPMSPISEGAQSEGDPQSPVSDMSEGEGSRAASRAPSEGSRPRSRAESMTDEIRQEIANSVDDEDLSPRFAVPENPVEKSNMEKFDEYLKQIICVFCSILTLPRRSPSRCR